MKNRGLAMLVTVLITGLFAASAFADQQAKKPEKVSPEATPLGKTEKVEKPNVAHNGNGLERQACGPYANWKYLVGEFSNQDGSTHFVRDGLSLGGKCRLNSSKKWLSFEFGAEYYAGKFNITHEESRFKGSGSYTEVGSKEWVEAIINLPHGVQIGAMVGNETTSSNGFKVSDLQVAYGSSWFDLLEFAQKHVTSDGKLGIWEAGLEVRFPLPKHFSLAFGGKYERYDVLIHVKLDDEGRQFLETLHYNVNSVAKDWNNSADFLYLTPGVNWCSKHVCISAKIPWAIFKPNKWSLGGELSMEWKF